jgi:hypothetical protein
MRAAGVALAPALAVSSIIPAVRTVPGLVKDRSVNGLAALIVVVNVVSIAVTFWTGDPRLMLAKDGSPRFGRLERIFSPVWGVTLLAECVTRVICAFTLPVNTMVWLSTVMTISAIGAGVIIGGPISGSMRKMVLLGAGR